MSLWSTLRRPACAACSAAAAFALGACATSVSTSAFKGEKHEVAQAISNLQGDATNNDQKKICERDLAQAIVSRLGGTKGCETALKEQLAQIDSLQLEVESIDITGSSARARVKSTYSGKLATSALSLVKEGGKWKVSSLG